NSNNVVVYPNPSRGKFEVTKTDDKTIDEIEVLDALGKSCYFSSLSGQTNKLYSSIQIPNLVPGIHFLKVRSGGKTSIRKIVLE
ncbi:MAG TPA: T9SS type A sorting domain-containing protein, partial [Catalimonadaceae bacterium]|nr:T9SS type A sorting domain-containing protein [Catalimonadaceae bacterium]